jgi:hypothetical protein
MGIDVASAMVAMRSAATQQSASIAIMKKNHEMQMSLLQMLDEVVRSAPPPGQGTVVDKIA